MVVYNAGTRELTAKIVYYGPGLGGKTTNLHVLHDRLDPATVGKLLNLATQTDRTIYFDLLPVELGDIKGYKIHFQLATVPGQTAFNETRRVVLKGADGIVFVADSQWTMLPKNLESWHNLKENLKANGVSFEGIPIVIQYNKRDLTDILSVDALQEALGLSSYPFVEAIASAGRGVTETFKLISKLTFVDLLRRLQGRRPEDAAATPARKDKDDLLSWKDSLLNRPTPAGTKRPLALVPPTEASEEAPFEAAEESQTQVEGSLEVEGPFAEATAPEPAAPSRSTLAPAELSERPTERIEYVDPVEAAKLAAPIFPSQAALPVEPQAASPAAPQTIAPPTLQKAAPPEFQATAPLPAPSAAPAARQTSTPAAPEAPAPIAPPARVEPRPAVTAAARSAEAVRPAMPPPPTPPVASRDDAKIRDMEARLQRAENALARERSDKARLEESSTALMARFEAFERDARALGKALSERQDGFFQRIDGIEKTASARQKETEPRIRALEERFDRGEKRQRTAEDDVSMALRTLSERGEKLNQHLEEIGEKIAALEGTLQEKTSQTRHEADEVRTHIEALQTALEDKTKQGRREAEDIRTQIDALQIALEEKTKQGGRESEDIRTQIAPLLEAHEKTSETHDRLVAEFDTLRESLAEALGEISERLRNAVQGI